MLKVWKQFKSTVGYLYLYAFTYQLLTIIGFQLHVKIIENGGINFSAMLILKVRKTDSRKTWKMFKMEEGRNYI